MITQPVTVGRSPWASRLRTRLTPSSVHYGGLVLGAVFSLVAATRLWLFYDDWAALVPSQPDLWAPHVGHWSTTPYLIFRGLQQVFGVDHFLPIAIPVTIAHLTLAHLMWRFMNKVGVHPWFATGFGFLLVFLGVGAENFLWAFQVGFVGAMALGTGAILLVLGERFRAPQIVGVVALTTLSVTFSGTALPMLVVLGLMTWWRRGWVWMLVCAGPAVVVYGIWFVLIGRFAPSAGRASSLLGALKDVPEFALKMLTDGLGRAFPVAIIGILLFVAVAVWGILSYADASKRAKPAYILFLAAPVFALATGYSRVGLGMETATSSRYLYFIVPVMLPLMALGLTELSLRLTLRVSAVLVLIALLVVYNFGGLVVTLAQRAVITSGTQLRMAAAAELVANHGAYNPWDRPDPQWMPDVTMSDVEAFVAHGWISGEGVTEIDRLELALAMSVTVDGAAAPGDERSCQELPPAGTPLDSGTNSVVVHAERTTDFDLRLSADATTSGTRTMTVQPGWSVVAVAGESHHMVLEDATNELEVCAA